MTSPHADALRAALEEIEKRANGATGTQWNVVEYGDGDTLVIHSNRDDRVCFMATHGGSRKSREKITANAEFIAHARSDIPYLLALLRERDAEIARMREVVAEIASAFETIDVRDGITHSDHAFHNLEGAIIDIERTGSTDRISLNALRRVAKQLGRIDVALERANKPEGERT